MKKILLIPDVHGRTFWRDALKNPEQFDKIIFFGDYGDPYGHEGITQIDALKELKDIIEFKQSNSDKVILLLGNHDLHYINGDFACSRYSYQSRHKYKELIVKNLELFKVAYEFKQKDQKYLCSHSGILKGWLEDIGYAFHSESATIFLNNLYITKQYAPFGIIGFSRGGWSRNPSCMWSDLQDHFGKDSAFPDYIQIFGHTQLKENAVQMEKLWCIDSRQLFILENGKLKEFNE